MTNEGSLYSVEKNRVEKKFEEMNSLINMASSMHDGITKKKKEIRSLLVMLVLFMYITLMSLILIKFYMNESLSSYKFNYMILVTVVFYSIIGLYTYTRFRDISQDLRVEREAMEEIMEIIFNLRKLFSRYGNVDIVELTILDLKLKRLRFF